MNSDMFHTGSNGGYRSRALDVIANNLANAGGLKRDIPSLTDEEVASALELDIDSYNVWIEELSSLMGEAIETLQEMERMVITLYYYEELTIKEIASVIGVTESRVSQIHKDAIIRLTERLKREGDLDNGK